MWAPFVFLAAVCAAVPANCLCRKGARCAKCMERDGLTKRQRGAREQRIFGAWYAAVSIGSRLRYWIDLAQEKKS
jgi:hypothetical protein